ncbi:MAG: AzlD domain-containing protein [Anaerolineae bacterium]|nr:AzlD domain-containing protein [Anaerolineae bacterium]
MSDLMTREVIMILGMMLVTFGVRYPVLALVGKIDLPEGVFRALRYVPPAVLTAITVPALFMPDGEHVFISHTNAYLVAGIVAVIVSWKTKSLVLTILIGMAVFLGWRWLTGLIW